MSETQTKPISVAPIMGCEITGAGPDVQRLVRAVNCRDELLAALKAIYECRYNDIIDAFFVPDEVKKLVVDAIAKAEAS